MLLKQIVEWSTCVVLCGIFIYLFNLIFFVMYVNGLCVVFFAYLLDWELTPALCIVMVIGCLWLWLFVSSAELPQPCVFLHNWLVCRWPCVIVMVMVMCFFCIVCCLYFLQNCKNENQLLLAMTLCFVSA